jgi:hypothetical protein
MQQKKDGVLMASPYFFPEHVFEWQMYKDKEGWYYEKDPKIQVPFAEEKQVEKFSEYLLQIC